MVIISVQGLSVLALAIPTGVTVRIKSAINTFGSGKCLDVAGGQTSAGTPIVQFDCHDGNNQRFVIERVTFGSQFIIKSDLNLNMCVGITDNVHANAYELVRLVPCRVSNGDAPLGARWTPDTIDGNTRFRAVSPSWDRQSTCIDVSSGSNSESLWMQLYYCHEGGNQQWRVFD
jgi:hypothetical protein